MGINYNFIQVVTGDGLRLNGLESLGDKDKTAFIFIHGFGTDFYTHDFYHKISSKLSSQGNLVILAQNRGTGLHTEFIKTDRSNLNIGSFYEKISEAHLDISAFVEYLLASGFQKIGLIGHSLGTIKAVRYLFEGEHKDKISKLILLAPFDKNAYLVRKNPNGLKDLVEKANNKIMQGNGKETIPVPDWDDYPVSYESFASWYEQTDLSNMWDFYRHDYDFPILNQIKIPIKVILGEKDEFIMFPEFGVSAQSALDTIKRHVATCETKLIEGSDHMYSGFEELVASEVAGFAD